MYELYNELLDKFGANEFAGLVVNWLDNAKENPFKEDSVERRLFFQAKKYHSRWRAGGIDMRSAKRNMIESAEKIIELNIPNPYNKEEIIKEEPKEEIKHQIIEEGTDKEITKEEIKEDVNYLMVNMVNSYNRGDNVSYEMYVTHLMDVAEENPFLLGTDEYEMFSTMKACYTHNPPNKRRTFVVGKQLCDLINNTELYPEKVEKKTVLGVLPEEKKNWLKFLFPWKKEGESDDSAGTD